MSSASTSSEYAAAAGKNIDRPINLLMVGIDERADDPAGGARADSIIIANFARFP